jgi:hypothetical protein
MARRRRHLRSPHGRRATKQKAPRGLKPPSQDEFLDKSIIEGRPHSHKLVKTPVEIPVEAIQSRKIADVPGGKIMREIEPGKLRDSIVEELDTLGKIALDHPEMKKVYPPDRAEVVQTLLNDRIDEEIKRERHRKVHIIDDLDNMRAASDKKYQDTLRKVCELTPLAKRFIFDKEASAHIGNFIASNINDVLDFHQFARPPYPVTYLQLDIDAAIRGIGHGSTADRPGWGPSRDLDTAYLIHENIVYPLARGEGSGGLSLFKYEMGLTPGVDCPCQPIFFGEPMYADEPRDHTIRAMLLLGSSFNAMKDNQTKWMRFIHTVQVHLNVGDEIYKGFTPEQREGWNKKNWSMILSAAGDYRIMLTALFLMNQQKHVEVIDVPANSMLIGGKRKVVRRHNRVVIRLQNYDTIRRSLGHVLATPRAEHDVRGHLRNVHVLKGCTHEWQYLSGPHDIQRWMCTRCKGLRTTVRAHKRGDASVGKATSQYEVKE